MSDLEFFCEFFAGMFCRFGEKHYLCNAKEKCSLKDKIKDCHSKANGESQKRYGPFVYRLGREIFIL